MRDEQCVRFLQWALPQLRMRWPGFRKVRGQVCKRIARRMRELDLDHIDAYRAWLEEHPAEWEHLDTLCRITISRFHRDRGVFETLARDVLPALVRQLHARGERMLRIWSAGCGSGEEPYTLSALWNLELRTRFPDTDIEIVATDANPVVLERARVARYGAGSLKDLPPHLRERMFSTDGDDWCLDPELARDVTFSLQDIRDPQPGGRFDLVLCRNLVFTYFDEELQREVLARIAEAMHDGAAIVLGAHERLPEGQDAVLPWVEERGIYRSRGRFEPASSTLHGAEEMAGQGPDIGRGGL